jgi:hypothetical protein
MYLTQLAEAMWRTDSVATPELAGQKLTGGTFSNRCGDLKANSRQQEALSNSYEKKLFTLPMSMKTKAQKQYGSRTLFP